jgi:hypothetical protein
MPSSGHPRSTIVLGAERCPTAWQGEDGRQQLTLAVGFCNIDDPESSSAISTVFPSVPESERRNAHAHR